MTSHPIVHIDIPAADRGATAEFYAQLFNWRIDNSADEMNYTMFESEGGPGGGFPELSHGYEAGHVIVYVATDDIDASLAKAESLGGKTAVPKTEIPGMGWFGIFTDPTGNSIGLYTGANGQS